MRIFLPVCVVAFCLIFGLPLFYVLEHHGCQSGCLIRDMCHITDGSPGYWYWLDGQSIPDSICATEYTTLTITPLKYGVEIVQPNGDVKFAAFDSKEAADDFIKIQPYQKRTLIQDKQRKK